MAPRHELERDSKGLLDTRISCFNRSFEIIGNACCTRRDFNYVCAECVWYWRNDAEAEAFQISSNRERYYSFLFYFLLYILHSMRLLIYIVGYVEINVWMLGGKLKERFFNSINRFIEAILNNSRSYTLLIILSTKTLTVKLWPPNTVFQTLTKLWPITLFTPSLINTLYSVSFHIQASFTRFPRIPTLGGSRTLNIRSHS